MDDKALVDYEAPRVTTYTKEEILEELGPAQAIISPVCDLDNLVS